MPKFKRLKNVFRPVNLSKKGAIAVVIVVIAVAVGLYFAFRPVADTSGTIPSNNPLATNNSGSSNTSDQTNSNQKPSPNTSASPNNAAPSGPAPITPYGDFVSNHHPGGSAPTSEASACNTTAGATCYIEFTKDGVVKKLDAHTTNANGGAIWYWDVDSAGLSSGSWTITAVATLNGQTRTANDIQKLVVQ